MATPSAPPRPFNSMFHGPAYDWLRQHEEEIERLQHEVQYHRRNGQQLQQQLQQQKQLFNEEKRKLQEQLRQQQPPPQPQPQLGNK